MRDQLDTRARVMMMLLATCTSWSLGCETQKQPADSWQSPDAETAISFASPDAVGSMQPEIAPRAPDIGAGTQDDVASTDASRTSAKDLGPGAVGVPLQCVSNADCNEIIAKVSPCGVALCSDGKCIAKAGAKKPGCCLGNDDCATGDPCEVGVCSKLGGSCTYFAACPACTDSIQCDDGILCTVDTCTGLACEHTAKPGCCDTDSDCSDGDACTNDLCAGNACVHVIAQAPDDALCCVAGELLGVDFEDGTTCDFAAAGGSGSVGWTASTIKPFAGAWSLYFGDPNKKHYALGKVASGTATTPPIALPGGVVTRLSFQLRLDIDTYAKVDVFDVQVLDQAGKKLETVWTKAEFGISEFGKWRPVAVNLSAHAGTSVRLRFSFDTKSAVEKKGEGVFIDDLHLVTLCGGAGCAVEGAECGEGGFGFAELCKGALCVQMPKTCSKDADCEDGIACTSDACSDAGQCRNEKTAGCCTVDVDCDDGKGCSIDACVMGTCLNTPQGADCCVLDAGCDDGSLCTNDTCGETGACQHEVKAGCCDNDAACGDTNACTIDACGSDHACTHEKIPHCCGIDSDCADGAECTADACVGGWCKQAPAAKPECCDGPTLAAWDFEGESAGLDVASASTSVLWATSDTRAHGGGTSLAFTNPVNGSYELPGKAVSGSVTTPKFNIPVDSGAALSFWVWADIEAMPEFDKLTLASLSEGEPPVTVWTKNAIPSNHYKTWHRVDVDLSSWAGKEVALRIAFDSVDSASNEGEGVFIDDLILRTGCLVPTGCSSATACDDGDPCTLDLCAQALCAHSPIAGCCSSAACCTPQVVSSEGFAGALPPQWQTFSESAVVGWNVVPWSSAPSTPMALYMGNAIEHNCADPAGGFVATVTSAQMSLDADKLTVLSFALYADIESTTETDLFDVVVVLPNGDHVAVFTKASLPVGFAKQLLPIEIPLSAWKGQAIRVAFVFESKDGNGKASEGIYIDDVTLTRTCSAP